MEIYIIEGKIVGDNDYWQPITAFRLLTGEIIGGTYSTRKQAEEARLKMQANNRLNQLSITVMYRVRTYTATPEGVQ